MSNKKKELTVGEIIKKIAEGKEEFEEIVIKGDLDFYAKLIDYINHPLCFRKVIFEGNLVLTEVTINGNLWLLESTLNELLCSGTTIKGELSAFHTTFGSGVHLEGATIEDNLELFQATIKGGMNLTGTKIKGNLDLSTKKGPLRIFVDQEMAQLVHWAAPTVPLVIKKRKQ